MISAVQFHFYGLLFLQSFDSWRPRHGSHPHTQHHSPVDAWHTAAIDIHRSTVENVIRMYEGGDIRSAVHWPTCRRSEKLCFIITAQCCCCWTGAYHLIWIYTEKWRIIPSHHIVASCEWHFHIVTDIVHNCRLLCAHPRAHRTEWQTHSFVASFFFIFKKRSPQSVKGTRVKQAIPSDDKGKCCQFWWPPQWGQLLSIIAKCKWCNSIKFKLTEIWS